jgi:hypothetical protein
MQRLMEERVAGNRVRKGKAFHGPAEVTDRW